MRRHRELFLRGGLALLLLYVWSIGLHGWYLGDDWWRWLLDPHLIGGLALITLGLIPPGT
jgi:hypothetical protein